MFRRFTRPLALLFAATLSAQNKAPTAPHELNGTYEELSPAQKKLIDEWYAEYNQMTHDNSQPTDYNQFSLSTRTTFEAVTHALMTTELTDKSGKSTGNALDLVQSIEAINGKVPRARGDLQFRIYVVLKPDALQKLKAASEFFRDRDNTVYHHGYPLNYRQDGGTPSIQISVAKDSRHARLSRAPSPASSSWRSSTGRSWRIRRRSRHPDPSRHTRGNPWDAPYRRCICGCRRETGRFRGPA